MKLAFRIIGGGARRRPLAISGMRPPATPVGDPARYRWLVVMVKIARAGAVKTRLGRQIGTTAATSFYRVTSAAVVGRLARDPRWRVVLAVSPDHGLDTPSWREARVRMAQRQGDLGRRMQRAFDILPPGPVVLIGSDIPKVVPRRIAEAFRALGGSPAVLGPAPDGGYWMVGQRRTPRVLHAFAGVRWSHPETRTDTERGFGPGRCRHVATLNDVDDEVSWRAVKAWSGRRVLPAAIIAEPSTPRSPSADVAERR